jgi:hypothetical protein
MRKLSLLLLLMVPAVAAAQQILPGVPDKVRPAAPPPVKAIHILVALSSARAAASPVGGQEVAASVELMGPAPCISGCGTYVNGQPAGGLLVAISSSNPGVAKGPQAGVLVPVGKTSQAFSLTTSGVASPTAVTISATVQGSGQQSATFTVYPPSLTGLTIDSSSVAGGAAVVHGTAIFNGPPASAGALVAHLKASNSAVQIPASVTVDLNKTVAPFDIHSSGVAGNTPVTISATQGDRNENATLTLTPAVMTDFVRAFPCRCGDLTVTLSGMAPPGGAVVNVASANANIASVPASITIPAGASTGVVPVTDHRTYDNQQTDISATVYGVTKKWNEYVIRMLKPDITIKSVALQDRYGNAITKPQDSQPFKMCVTVGLLHTDDFGIYQYPGPSALRVAYLGPTGTGTSVGHEWDVNIDFHVPGGLVQQVVPCVDLPGLEPNRYFDVTLTADYGNKIDESNEGNNTHKLRISR